MDQTDKEKADPTEVVSDEKTEKQFAKGSGKSPEDDNEQGKGSSPLKSAEAANEENSSINTEAKRKTSDTSRTEEGDGSIRGSGDETRKQENPILAELKEAFPNIEERYIKAVIIASQGVLPSAFNALLYLSDPSFENEAELPSQPVLVPSAKQQNLQQLQQDELLARKLRERFNRETSLQGERPSRHHRDSRRSQNRPKHRGTTASDDDDSPDEFIETINRGIQETSKKVTQWWDGLKKNWAEEKERLERSHHQTSRSQRDTRQRFNSFGEMIDDEVIRNDSPRDASRDRVMIQDNFDDDEDENNAPRKLPPRPRQAQRPVSKGDTDDEKPSSQTRLWQPLPPAPASAKPIKISAKGDTGRASSKGKKGDPDQDEFLINSDDEL
ncbi:HBR254Cp [Eremothecium sinecaudum]|uniref:HBR254Cp n=1 Tax=Eremothecium sinecaudum TaxID=45286 RepID=A0A120K199_9SACH|nr:HBR254Cp [Eremothecium sinecaudum]AMD19155.1 HBR254Cp [Eremothecium sinecaudum]